MKPTKVKQDLDFISAMIPSDLLENSIYYIKENFAIEDIYTEDEIRDCVERMGLKIVEGYQWKNQCNA